MASRKRKKKACGHRNPCNCGVRRIKRKRTRRNPAPLGTGVRFKALVKKLMKRNGSVIRDPRALAAWIGRKKHGSKKLQQLAARGKWRHRVASLTRRKAANPHMDLQKRFERDLQRKRRTILVKGRSGKMHRVPAPRKPTAKTLRHMAIVNIVKQLAEKVIAKQPRATFGWGFLWGVVDGKDTLIASIDGRANHYEIQREVEKHPAVKQTWVNLD